MNRCLYCRTEIRRGAEACTSCEREGRKGARLDRGHPGNRYTAEEHRARVERVAKALRDGVARDDVRMRFRCSERVVREARALNAGVAV